MPTIDEKLDAILAGQKEEKERDERILRGLALLVNHLGAAPRPAGGSSAGGSIATDAEMAGKYGDPEVRLNPRDWAGESFKGSKFSECPPDFLDLLAIVFDDFAAQESDPKKKTYKLRDAKLARGWAARKRAQQQQQPPADEPAPDEL